MAVIIDSLWGRVERQMKRTEKTNIMSCLQFTGFVPSMCTNHKSLRLVGYTQNQRSVKWVALVTVLGLDMYFV